MKALLQKKRKYFDVESDLIDALIESHNQVQLWQTKRQILSLFANDFSQLELKKMIPGLSKWRIDQARNHATETGKGQPILVKPICRARIENAKLTTFWTTFQDLNCFKMWHLGLKH